MYTPSITSLIAKSTHNLAGAPVHLAPGGACRRDAEELDWHLQEVQCKEGQRVCHICHRIHAAAHEAEAISQGLQHASHPVGCREVSPQEDADFVQNPVHMPTLGMRLKGCRAGLQDSLGVVKGLRQSVVPVERHDVGAGPRVAFNAVHLAIPLIQHEVEADLTRRLMRLPVLLHPLQDLRMVDVLVVEARQLGHIVSMGDHPSVVQDAVRRKLGAA
mmetsp:Transcript_11438/g.34364  ORF Transcript_11438/g.34364 Transcript_11438/m.34364 type:complete len:217 (+) Transcript_11438:236-886(+)